MSIELREITIENFHECIKLSVKEEQKRFVASNMYSLAEAKADNVSIPLGIYQQDTLVGFTMYWFDEKNEMGWIDRLMIGAKYQGNGYGKATMVEVIDRLKSESKCKKIRTSYEPNNLEAERLYESLGFKKTGEISYGEVETMLYT